MPILGELVGATKTLRVWALCRTSHDQARLQQGASQAFQHEAVGNTGCTKADRQVVGVVQHERAVRSGLLSAHSLNFPCLFGAGPSM